MATLVAAISPETKDKSNHQYQKDWHNILTEISFPSTRTFLLLFSSAFLSYETN